MLEQGPTTCERCGGPLRLVIHPSGIIFRGGGFYKTDSRSSKGADTGGGSATPAATDGSGGTGGAKPEGGKAGSADKGSATTSTSEPAKPAEKSD